MTDAVRGGDYSSERQNTTLKYSTTPLLDLDGDYYRSQSDNIKNVINERRKDIAEVYGNDADHAETWLWSSMHNALLNRADKALQVRNAFAIHEAPELKDLFDKYNLDRNISELFAWGQEYERLNGTENDLSRSFEIKDEDYYFYMYYKHLVDILQNCKSPDSALRLIVSNPGISSVELASQNHPLYWDATNDMNDAVMAAIRNNFPDAVTEDGDVQLAERQSKIKIARAESQEGHVRFVIIPKKRLFAYDAASDVSVIKRSSYILDLSGAHQTNHQEAQASLQSKIEKLLQAGSRLAAFKQRELKPGLAEFDDYELRKAKIAAILDILLAESQQERPTWLQPVATSYYAARSKKLSTFSA